MSRRLRWVCVLLPCMPGLTLLAGGVVLRCVARDSYDTWRAVQVLLAGGGVIVAGLLIGTIAVWSAARSLAASDEETDPELTQTEQSESP